MKKNLYIILLIAIACNEQSQIPSVQGKLNNASGETIYLVEMSPKGIFPIDTTTIDEQGAFSFKYNIKTPGFYQIKFTDKNFATVVLDSGQNLRVTGDARDLANTYAAEGSVDTKNFIELNNFLIANYRKRDSISTIFQNQLNASGVDPTKMDSLNAELEAPFNKLVEDQNNFIKDFIRKNSESLASLAAIQQLEAEEHIDTYELLSASLSKKYPTSSYVSLFNNNLKNMKRVAVGASATEITLNDTTGKEISLSSLRGKIVLLDFWASWCGPCLEENPNLVKIYEKFKKRGFEIYAVSLDKSKDKWTEAITKGKLEWIQVSDLKYMNSPVADSYNIKNIPSNFLIDNEGKIIAKNLFGKELEEKLAAIFQ